MYRRFAALCSSSLLVNALLPLAVAAQAPQDIQFVEQSTVGRGEFVREAIQALEIAIPRPKMEQEEYVRVPSALLPYVRAADQAGALDVLGEDLRLALPIRRGEALRIIVKLTNVQPSATVDTFRDANSPAEQAAVAIAVEKQWLEPLQTNYFGVDRVLTPLDARKLLLSASGKLPQQQAPTTRSQEKDDVPTITITVQPKGNADFPRDELFNSVWGIINQDYLYQDRIDRDAASYDALESMVQSLDDPYSTFMRPQNSRNFRSQIQGEVSGIGAQVEMRNDSLTIVTPLTGSPAEKAGLKPGDQITAVDGESLQEVNFLDAVEMIRGQRGSTVKLMIRRNGVQFETTVTRDVVRVPEIEISWQGEVAIVKLMQFGKLTESELRQHMEHIQEQNPKGIVLDLRNNPGGLLHAANIVIGNFVDKGTPIAKIKTRSSERIEHTDEEPTINHAIPLVVLINKGSASASEIVAGALQDHGRATILGETTFGKGTVQEVLEFTDGSSLKLTIAEWFTPDGRKIDGVGVEPDMVINYQAERDSQLLRALELLR